MSDILKQLEGYEHNKYPLLDGVMLNEAGFDLYQIGQSVRTMILPFTREFMDPPFMVDYPIEEIEASLTKGRSVVAMQENNVIGHSRYKIHPGFTNEDKLLIEVGSVIVHPDYSGNGLSKALIASSIWMAKSEIAQLGSEAQIISVVGNINTASIAAFESMARKHSGIRKLTEEEVPSNLTFLIPETSKVIFDLTNM